MISLVVKKQLLEINYFVSLLPPLTQLFLSFNLGYISKYIRILDPDCNNSSNFGIFS